MILPAPPQFPTLETLFQWPLLERTARSIVSSAHLWMPTQCLECAQLQWSGRLLLASLDDHQRSIAQEG